MNEEEIIEIIEELMCLYKEQMNCDKYYNEIVERSTRNFKALQGLLDLYNKEKERNKDLEEIEKEHKEENGRLREENKNLEKELEEKDMQHELELIGKEEFTKANMAEIIEHYYTANEDCIPISKLKEKIEELTKIKGDLATYIATSERIKVLQELLEESEK